MPINIKRDIVYRQVDGLALHLDAYWPKTGGPYPGLILMHGGGWTQGDEDGWAVPAQALAAQGWACFAVDYRKAPGGLPGVCWPAQGDDVRAAVAWVRANAATYRLDPARLGGIGGSAGAHLVAWAASVGLLRAAVSWSGPQYLPEMNEGDAVVWGKAVNLIGCDPSACPDLWQDASPRAHVGPAAAPLSLAHSDADPIPVAQATRMADALAAAGIPHEIYVAAEIGTGLVTHGIAFWDHPVVKPAALAFLKTYV